MNWPGEFSWLPLFSEFLIKSTLALTLALILILLFRKRSASLRHFVLAVALVGLLLLPILSSLGIGWKTALLPATNRATPVRLAAPSDKLLDGEMPGGPPHPHDGLSLPEFSTGREGLAHGAQPLRLVGHYLKIALPFVWFAGLVLLLLRLAAGILGAFRLTREGETVRDSGWRVLLERFLAAVHLQREVRLKSHCDVLIPLTWGFLKPVVIVPDNHEAWTEEQRSSTLVHELSHIKRADFLVMVLVRLSLALFWFNPLSWVVFRRLKREQEEACDELALKTGIKPSTYAANLLFFKNASGSRLSHFASLLGLLGFGRSAFNERLSAILKQKWIFQEVKMKTKIMLFCAVILAVALIGLARPSAPLAERAEAAAGSFITAAPDVPEMTAFPVGPEVQGVHQSQEQSQAEEKKAQEKKQQEQAQAQEEQKQKQEKKKPAVVTIKEGEKHQHKIQIVKGDKVRTIVVDKPVIIKEGKNGKCFLVTTDGKEVKVGEGEPGHLEFEADHFEVIEEGKILKVGKDDGVVYIIVKPDVDIGEAIRVALKGIPVAVKVAERAEPHISIEPGIEVDTYVTPHATWVSEDMEKDIREKLRGIREKLKAVEEKKLELRAVDEALADLEKDLEKMSKEISAVELKHNEKPEVFTIVKERADEEVATQVEPDIGVDIGEHVHKDAIRVIVKEKGSFSMCCQADPGQKGRETYDRIVQRVKTILPKGCTLEPEFKEETGLICLKIKCPFEEGATSNLMEKLADSIKDEMKEKKE